MITSRRMMHNAILSMSPCRAVRFNPKLSKGGFTQWYGDMGVESESVDELRSDYDAWIAEALAGPSPIWC